MKKRWKLYASMFGGALCAAILCVCFCQINAKAGEDREISQSTIMNYVVGIQDFSDTQLDEADFNNDNKVNMLDAVVAERIEVYGEDYLDKGKSDSEETTEPEETKEPEQTTEPSDDKNSEDTNSSDESDESGNVVYLNAINTDWEEAYIYSWENGTELTPMEAVEGYKGVYKAALPDGVSEFLFINNDDNQWDGNRQTVNVTFDKSGMTFVIESASGGKFDGSWKEIDYE